MATVDSVGEDKEVELKIIKKGITIEYVNDALIYDEKTQKSDVFVNQRRRWIAAQLDYFRDYFFDGLKGLLFKGNIDYFDKVIQMVQPPRILLTGILFIVTFLLWFVYILNLNSIYNLFPIGYERWLILFVVTAFTLIISIPRKFYNGKTLKALMYIPVGFVLMILSLLKVKGASKKFIHTTHSHTDNIKHN
jgi:cellulose synthase/poly-beta-1,6-N-acetylglucosamine synthase-like glycosyltransferase